MKKANIIISGLIVVLMMSSCSLTTSENIDGFTNASATKQEISSYAVMQSQAQMPKQLRSYNGKYELTAVSMWSLQNKGTYSAESMSEFEKSGEELFEIQGVDGGVAAVLCRAIEFEGLSASQVIEKLNITQSDIFSNISSPEENTLYYTKKGSSASADCCDIAVTAGEGAVLFHFQFTYGRRDSYLGVCRSLVDTLTILTE